MKQYQILLLVALAFVLGAIYAHKLDMCHNQENKAKTAVIALPDSVRVLDNLALEIKQRGNATPEEAVKLARWLKQDTVTDAPVLKYWLLIDSLENENL